MGKSSRLMFISLRVQVLSKECTILMNQLYHLLILAFNMPYREGFLCILAQKIQFSRTMMADLKISLRKYTTKNTELNLKKEI